MVDLEDHLTEGVDELAWLTVRAHQCVGSMSLDTKSWNCWVELARTTKT